VKQKFTLFIACYSLFCTAFFAQNNAGCPNANLSMGNFNNWQGFTGNYSNPAAAMGIVNGRHTIMTGAGTDPFSCGGLPIVPPGSTASARLGNSGTGAEGEQLRYTMTVTPQNALFIYKYACVLEDPGHPPNAQPVFQMRLLGPNGNQRTARTELSNLWRGQVVTLDHSRNKPYCLHGTICHDRIHDQRLRLFWTFWLCIRSCGLHAVDS